MKAWIVGGSLLLVALASPALFGWLRYRTEMRQAYERLRGQSQRVSSAHGDIEYKVGGSGIDVLVVHGAGGGYDQGELLARALLMAVFAGSLPRASVICVRVCRRDRLSKIRPVPMPTCWTAWAFAKLPWSPFRPAALPLSTSQFFTPSECPR